VLFRKYTLSAFFKCNNGTLDINFKPERALYPHVGYGERVFTITDEWVEYSVTTPVFASADPVTIPDLGLRDAVQAALGITDGRDPTEQEMQDLPDVIATERSISDLTGIEYAMNLRVLNLEDNQISDISALSGLTGLVFLNLHGNQISDISVLSGLTNLMQLKLDGNQVSDVSPLQYMTNLTLLRLQGNPLSWDAYCVYGPILFENNPGIYIAADDNPYDCDFPPAPTPVGSDVVVTPTDSTTGAEPVTLVFEDVTVSGGTSLTTSDSGDPPLSGFQLGDPPKYYEITTTASYVGTIYVCISYSGVTFSGPPEALRLYHYEGGWIDCTDVVDTENETICGWVSSLSPFVILLDEAKVPPVFESLTANPNILWPPNHKMIPITVNWVVLDDSGLEPTVELKNITMNEGEETDTFDPSFDDTLGDGHTTDDIQIIDDVIYLRAERGGTGIGRVYTLTYKATDLDENVGTATVTVTVPHEAP